MYNVCKAQLVGRDVAAVACTNHLLPWRNIRKQGAKKAIQHGCVIREGENYSDFWDILTENLQTKYGVSPVHTLDEIHLLHHLFPFIISGYCYDDIQAIESGLERNALNDVEIAADGVDDNPEEPLLMYLRASAQRPPKLRALLMR